jgi:hypothetical protein
MVNKLIRKPVASGTLGRLAVDPEEEPQLEFGWVLVLLFS